MPTSTRFSWCQAIRLAHIPLLAFALLGACLPAAAQPDKPLTLVVGFPPGGTLDSVARLLADRLRTKLGRTVLVDARPGAGGIIATERVKNAQPDGDTLFVSTVTAFTLYPLITEKLPYKGSDFVPVVHLARFEYALGISSTVPAKDAKEYVALARREPRFALVGAPGLAGPPPYYGQIFGRTLGLDVTIVPYNGTAPLMQDFQGGQTPAAVLPLAEFSKLAQSGKARLLAVAGATRARNFPDVPTFSEVGVPVAEYGQYAVFAPAATPAAALKPVIQAVQEILQTTEVKARFATMYMEPTGQAGADLTKTMKESAAFWESTVKAGKSSPPVTKH